MHLPRNWTKATLTLIVLLIVSVTPMAIPLQIAKADLPQATIAVPAGVTPDVSVSGTCALSVTPWVVGVNQPLLMNFWVTPAVNNNRFFPGAFEITITKPDGTKDVITSDSEVSTGAGWTSYVPTDVGTYSFQLAFLGTYFPAGVYLNGEVISTNPGPTYVNNATGSYYPQSGYYKPCTYGPQNVTVQQDMVYSYPPAALPSDYWTRPAILENREWWPILGNWPGTGYQGGGPTWDELYPNTNPCYSTNYGFTPWVQAPNTAHILREDLGAVAGLIGGPAGIYGATSSPGSPTLIYAGRCYQTKTIPINGVPTSCATCYDLRTGEMYYAIPTSQGGFTPSYIAYLNPEATSTVNVGEYLGSRSWSVELWGFSGSNLIKINPATGSMTANVSVSPLTTGSGIQSYGGGTVYYNQIGGYCLTLQRLGALPSTTSAPTVGTPIYNLINWTTRGSGNLASRIVSNITIDAPGNIAGIVPGSFNVGTVTGGGSLHVDFNVGIAGFVGKNENPLSGIMMGTDVAAYNIYTGDSLWNFTLPNTQTYSPMCAIADHGLIAFLVSLDAGTTPGSHGGYWLAYDLFTGRLAWKSDAMDLPWDAEGAFGAYSTQSAYGMFFRQAYSGVYAWNWTNGKMVWHYSLPTEGNFETPYTTADGTGVYSFNGGGIIADGKMYVTNTEHTPTWPMTRGWALNCINITTGELVWKITDAVSTGAIADGYMVSADSQNGYMYTFGKGKSATTVSAPDVSVPLGTAFTIKGTVLDMSAAQPGTPCVSASSMETQMEYLHLQMPIDGIWHNLTITGVPVTLIAIASDGTVTDLGSVTTNGYYGTFEKAWTPPAEGTYQIIASFASDDSYGSSAAATAVTVGPAPEPYPQPVETTQADYTMIIMGAAAAIIIAVAIVGLLLFLALRKR
jgi:hypothetical protein